jgi:hypothetical protein
MKNAANKNSALLRMGQIECENGKTSEAQAKANEVRKADKNFE